MDRGNFGSRDNSEELKELAKKKTSGKLSYATISRIEKRFEYWFEYLRAWNRMYRKSKVDYLKRFVLITLTLPAKQFHKDEELKIKALRPFLRKIVNDYKLDFWFWRAEKQKNGSIHFHIIVDKYISIGALTQVWYDIMFRLRYIEKWRKNNPQAAFNSVDVKGQNIMRNPVRYLLKYVTKENKKRQVSGAQWRMSYNLSKISEFRLVLSKMNIDKLNLRADTGYLQKKINDYAIVYKFSNRDKMFDRLPELRRAVDDFYDTIVNRDLGLIPSIYDEYIDEVDEYLTVEQAATNLKTQRKKYYQSKLLPYECFNSYVS